MRVKEAEKQFEADKRAHDRHCEKFMNKIRIIGGVIGSVLTVAGIVLFIVGANKSDHVTDYIYGGMCLGTGVLILFTVVFLFPFYTNKKYRVYVLATKNLYRNYLSCTDMDDDGKEFYRRKLEEIRSGKVERNVVLYSRSRK